MARFSGKMTGLRAHPDFDKMVAALQSAHATRFRGILYRACDPLYANTRDLLSGEGGQAWGGRWNPPRSFATTYLAASIEGAIAETLGLPSHYGFDPARRLPLTLVAVEATLDFVLDLTDPAIRNLLRVTLGKITHCDWRNENAVGREALTQALGRAAFQQEAHGIIVPSAVKRTFRNINVFPANLGGGNGLVIRRAQRLPPPPASGVL